MNLARKLLLSLICLIAPLVLTFLAERVSWRMDWTAKGLYTVSTPSREILNQIETPVEFTLYYTPSVENIPVRIRNFAHAPAIRRSRT